MITVDMSSTVPILYNFVHFSL